MSDVVGKMWSGAAGVARFVDELPVGPAKVADLAVGRFMDRRAARAAQDPTWAAIEARRHVEGRSTTLFLSDRSGGGPPGPQDLTMADWFRQLDIASQRTPDPAWLGLAFRVRQASLTRLVGRVRWSVQRARRGWSDRDAWGVDRHLARVASEMLAHLAEHTHGWPGTDEFPTFEEWTAALRHHSAVLALYVHDNGAHAEAQEAWFELSKDWAADPTDTEAAAVRMRQLEEEQYDAAVASMHWIAEQFGGLWD